MRSIFPKTTTTLAGAALATVAGWLPPAPGSAAPPETVARSIAIDAASLLPPAARDAAAAAKGTLVASRPVTTIPHEVCAPIEFTAVGLTWHQPGRGHVDARVSVSSGPGAAFGPAAELESDYNDGPAPGEPEHRPGARATALLWTGAGRCVRFDLSLPAGEPLSELRAVFLNTSGTAFGGSPSRFVPGEVEPPPGLATAGARPGQPAFITRQGWGADEKLKNCEPDVADRVKMSFVHHTASGNDYSRDEADDVIRAIYAYHTGSRGFCDIAYNFLVDRFGRSYVGRSGGITKPIVSAATGGFNTGSVSVSAIGNYDQVSVPSAVVGAIERVLAWRLDLAHVPPNGTASMTAGESDTARYPKGTTVKLPVISGHRQTNYTNCPGRIYDLLPKIRSETHVLGAPKIFRPAQSRSSFVAVKESVTYTAFSGNRLSWRVELIKDGKVVRTLKKGGTQLAVSWNGTAADGDPVAPGAYTARIWGTDGQGRYATEARFSVTVRLS